MAEEKGSINAEQRPSRMWRVIFRTVEGLYAREKQILRTLYVVNALSAFFFVYIYFAFGSSLEPADITTAESTVNGRFPSWLPTWARNHSFGTYAVFFALILNIFGATMRMCTDDTLEHLPSVARFGRCLETTGVVSALAMQLMAGTLLEMGFEQLLKSSGLGFSQQIALCGIFLPAFGTLAAYHIWQLMLLFARWWKGKSQDARTSQDGAGKEKAVRSGEKC